MAKGYFFYATGTSYVVGLFTPKNFTKLFPIGGGQTVTVAGYNGRNASWDGVIANDPFPKMLDPNKWIAKKISYPATAFPMLASINVGVANTVKAIQALPKGTPFCLGGYSQGAAVMSLVLQNYLQSPSSISSRYADLKGAVMFGNPCRQEGRTWPAFKTYPGGSYSGRFDVPGSTTGGHGVFIPSYRLTNTPSTWFEFVGGNINNVDVINCVGDTTNGTYFSAASWDLLTLSYGALLSVLLSSVKKTAVEAALAVGPAGHMAYPFEGPPGYSPNGPTSYQIALEYLDYIGDSLNNSPDIALPTIPKSPVRSWGTTLKRPVA